MPESAWLTIVIGFSGVVAMVGVGLVVRSLRPGGGRSLLPDHPHSSSPVAAPEPARRAGVAIPFRRRPRSVVGNVQRALERIDSIDPYANQRRIGEALTDTRLRGSAPSGQDSAGAGHTWPFGLVSGERRHKDGT